MGSTVSKVLGGSGGNASSPKAPDYEKLMNQQAEIDRKAAIDNTKLANPTKVNPYGSVSYTNKGGQDVMGYTKDQKKRRKEISKKLASKDIGSARRQRLEAELAGMQQSAVGKTPDDFVQEETWDPRVTASHDQAMDLQSKTQQALLNQGEFEAPATVNYDPNAGDTMAKAALDKYYSRATPEQDRRREMLTTRLRQSGLQPGTEAFDRAMKNEMTSQLDANTAAGFDSVKIGYDEASRNYRDRLLGQAQEYSQADQNYARPWNMAADAQSMRNAQWTPQFQGFSGYGSANGADMVGAANANYQTAMGNASTNAAKNSGILSGVGNAVGSIWNKK